MYICALHGSVLTLLIAVLNFVSSHSRIVNHTFMQVHIFRDGTFVSPMFGPLAILLPKVLCDALFEVVFLKLHDSTNHNSKIALVFTVMMWILIPSHSALQFIALSRSSLYVWFGNWRSMFGVGITDALPPPFLSLSRSIASLTV